MQQALAGQELVRPWIGIRYVRDHPRDRGRERPARSRRAPGSRRRTPRAARSTRSWPTARRRTPGLQDGDIIVAVEGTAIDADSPLDDILTQYAPGRAVALEVLRDGERITLALTLGTRPANL